MPVDEKIQLVYLASTGRAGSTILEMMLNAHPLVWTLGEFDILPWEVRTNTKPCGCGQAIEACPFWGPIIREHRQTIMNGELNRFRLSHKADRALRYRELPYVLGHRAAYGRGRAAAIDRYAESNAAILRAVLSSARKIRGEDVTWLVDSSKSPYRLLWLAASGHFDLHVIHLMKDPRAFAYSMSKTQRGLDRAYRAMRAALRWQVQNRLFDMVIRHYVAPERALHLRYEELATDAERVMQEICEWLAIPLEPGTATRFREGNHGVAGNPARAESKPITLDDKWRRELPASLATASFLLNRGLARRYGYVR